ncbi:hypothetical protein SAMN04488029_3825 [Reichenbachiella faecimaris]|uniref:Lipoprotein n=1 Tax=Reichenbachiella faecimaris TaxID=692418 RepID=A0A1W2GPL2_REIFA|nr:hypothetical protein [Reichenbachiella faecimaris]SMD38599.1 hypothetical protein SAMN04488029_3825 [Reichenbachiella faecimaris]
MKHIPALFTILIVVVFTYSCGSGSNSEDRKNIDQMLADKAETKTIHDIDQLLKDLPTPSLVPFTLKSVNAGFDNDLINNLDNVEKYKGNSDKMAMNMGVFASDVSYLAAYGLEDQCLNYLKMSHNMAKVLGDSTIYDDTHLENWMGHIKNQNQQEISKLLSELFITTSIQMEEGHHLNMAGLALAGSFIEGLYQAVVTIDKYSPTEKNEELLRPLVKVVLDQEPALKEVIQVLNDLPNDDAISTIVTELQILDILFKGGLKEIDEKMKADPNFKIKKHMLVDIDLEIKRIRQWIVE